MNHFDDVIVGAGTAGCVLANRLSADPRNSVLLLEAGGTDNYLWIHIPVGYLYCIDNPRTDWRYRTEPEAGLNGRSLLYPRGKVLGGCSSINGMIYMRGQSRDYDDWCAQGCEGWSWKDVLPHFLRSEDHHGGATAVHGAGNEMRVERQRLSWQILDAFRDAAAQAGIPKSDDFNTGDNFGSSYFEVTQRRGVRWNASKAFLRPARARKNLRVITGAQVQHLVLDAHKRCTGLDVLINGQPQRFHAHREVVLCAGAIGSPAILERSGIGNPRHLASVGLGCQVELPGVGENLQDHLQLRMAFKIQGAATLNAQAATWWGRAMMGARYLWNRSGPLSMAPSQLGCFAKTRFSPDRADVEYHVQPLSLERFGQPLHREPAFTASVCHLRPSSRGSVHVASAQPLAAPRIAPNYLATEQDRLVAADALRLTRTIAAQPALAPFQPREFVPGTEAQSTEALIEAAGRIGTTIFHPVGTCRMGDARRPDTVVDTRLRVRGVPGLRVADASVMPTITSGNTNAPTMMIAEKAAIMLIEDRAR